MQGEVGTRPPPGTHTTVCFRLAKLGSIQLTGNSATRPDQTSDKRLATLVLDILDDEIRRQPMMGMIRAATPEPEALGDQTYESLARKGETITTAAMVT